MRFLKSIFSRWVIISLLILFQIVSFCIILFIFSKQYFYVSIFCEVLSILILLKLISNQENPNHKIPWIIVILLIPPAGLLIYLIFGKGYITKKHSRLYQSVNDRQRKYVVQDENIKNDLYNFNEKYLSQSNYIYNTSKTPICMNTQVQYLNDGSIYFEKLFEDLRNAKKFIFLEYFILGEGELLNEIIDILSEKVKEGLDVRVIYDDIGSIKVLPYDFEKTLNKLGIKCIKFNKYYPIASVVYNNRDHRKIAVIDGYIAYTGGINIADEYNNYITKFGYWKDTGVRLYGEAVKNFTLMFLKTYDVYSNTKSNYEEFQPYKYHPEDFKSDGFIQPFGDGPAPIYDNYVGENVYLNIINQATKYVYITTPYLIVDHLLMSAIENASKRGVDIRIITPGIPDKKIINLLTKDSYNSLIKAGVKIFEYQPGFIHAKTVIADDEVGVVGTINFDYRSLVHHFECGCYMVNSSCILDVKKDFLLTLEKCKMPNKKDYYSKNIFKRLFINVLKFFAPLL